ncbi:MAG: glycine cleavage system protein GcvH [Planctomycetes bacterium]|nr:glycine cleavage system protein GcvH [Planctomycetota bacterium]
MINVEGYEFPEDLLYHREHAWARIEEDGTVTVGMNAFAAEAAGEIMYVDLPDEGDELEAGETCAKLQTAKWVGRIAAPLSGKVIEVNEDLGFESEIINNSPYDEGWILKIQPADLESEQGGLMSPESEELRAWLKQEIARAEAEKQAGGAGDEDEDEE